MTVLASSEAATAFVPAAKPPHIKTPNVKTPQNMNARSLAKLSSGHHKLINVDNRVSLALTRVISDAMQTLSPDGRDLLESLLAAEVRRLRDDAEQQFDVISDVAASVLEESLDICS